MTALPSSSKQLIVAAMVFSTFNLLLIWMFRFLPLYDYPVWLYEVRVMRALSEPQFSEAYELFHAPVPNLGFIGPVWLLSFLFPLEVCGKIVLSLCVVGFPWAVWYALRRIAGDPHQPAAFIGFPFAFNIYLYGGNAFLVGCILMMLILATYVPRVETLSRASWLILSLLLLATYFAHLIAYVLLAAALVGVALSSPHPAIKLRSLLLALLPSAACLVWYLTALLPREFAAEGWSVWGFMQNVTKPLVLFIKSYGISNHLPLTTMNVLWMAVLLAFLRRSWLDARRASLLDGRFVLAAIVSLVGVFTLPKQLLGVYEPGVRFGLPALIFAVLVCSRVKMPAHWAVTFLVMGAFVGIYNAFHFKKVDEQMRELYSDISAHVEMRNKSFRSFRFDYPPPRSTWDVVAPSVDPLFGAVYYAALEAGGGEAWIFGTAALRARGNGCSGQVAEVSKAAIARRLLGDRNALPCDILVLVGNDPAVVRELAGYPRPYRRGRSWTILTMN